ncbi:MAG: hypothetical protein Q9177_006834, partial [Variospora cf. flavescens]
ARVVPRQMRLGPHPSPHSALPGGSCDHQEIRWGSGAKAHSNRLLAQGTAGEAVPGAKEAIIAPADMVALLLTVVTILLGVVAFIISIAALVGYTAIRDNAVTMAQAAAIRKIKEIAPQLASAAAETIAREVAVSVATDATERHLGQVLERLSQAGREEERQGEGLPSGEGADAYAQTFPGAATREGP